MSLKVGLTLAGAFLGAWSLGALLTLQARTSALIQDGTFRALGPLAASALGGILLGSAIARLRSRSNAEKTDPLPQQEHRSILSEVAADAARKPTLDTSLLLASLAAPLVFVLPLGAVLFLATGGTAPRSSGPALLVAATACAALLYFTQNALVFDRTAPAPDSARQRTRTDRLRLSLAILGLLSGVLTGSRVSSALVGFNELATTAVLVMSAVAILYLLNSGLDRVARTLSVAVFVVGTGKAAAYFYSQLDDIYERITDRKDTKGDERFAHVLQNRHGVLTVTTSGWLYENGRVQGIFNTNPIPAADLNRCSRAYVIPSAVRDPESILLLGLGSGSFSQILAHYPSVKSLTILEENPAYEQAVQNSGIVASLLQNQRVQLVYGSIPSTLRQQGKFDVIIQDRLPFRKDAPSPYLTKEFFERLRSHLNARGAVYVNTLGNAKVERALVETFPHLLRYQDMIFGSQERLKVDGYKWMRDLMAWEIDGQRVLSTRRDPTEVARHIVQNREFRGNFSWEREESIRERTQGTPPLTERTTVAPWWHFTTLL